MREQLAVGVPAGELHQELSDDDLDAVVGGLYRVPGEEAVLPAVGGNEVRRVQVGALSLVAPVAEAALPC